MTCLDVPSVAGTLGICARCRYRLCRKLITGKLDSDAQRKSLSRTFALIISFLLVVSSLAFAHPFRTVKRVVDGDTLVLENGERVRLLGVDTPESLRQRDAGGFEFAPIFQNLDPKAVTESQAEILHNCKRLEVGAVAKMELCSCSGTI